MATNISNALGKRGERIFELTITDLEKFDFPLFNPAHLGDKWPVVDYYVELCGIPAFTPFFFVQVKTTQSLVKKEVLEVRVSQIDCENLFKITAPTYLAGVHEPSKRVFILALNKLPSQGVYSIPLEYELTPKNLKILYKEIKEFWQTCFRKPSTSYFL